MVTDVVADALTRIRNASMVKHPTVDIPASKLKVELIKLLKEEGYVEDYEVAKDGAKSTIKVTLKYVDGASVITSLQRVSSPGLRTYSKSKNLPKVLDGLGIAVISTSKGVMSDKKARTLGVGGEVIAYIW